MMPTRTLAGAPTPNTLADLGAASPDLVLTITVYLQPSDPAGLATFVAAVQTPGDPAFHRFLTGPQFIERFSPTAATFSRVEATLAADGLAPVIVYGNRLALRVRGSVDAINRTFGLDIHQGQLGGRTGLFSTRQPTFPINLAGAVEAVGGFETLNPTAPGPDRNDQVNTTGVTAQFSTARFPASFLAATGITHAPGSLTPADYERIYDVAPLVQQGASGAHETIAIVTLDNFLERDTVDFWSRLGIARTGSFTIDNVNGSAGEPIDEIDAESQLDTEQSGAIAPGADVIAYVSAGGGATALLDGYEVVASENRADVVSSSFGQLELNFGKNGTELNNATLLAATRTVFSELAAQGETVFVASGDAGAFGINRNESGFYEVFPTVGGAPAYTPVLSVNAIAASPLVTAAGGTTLPVVGTDTTLSPPVTATIPVEQPWSQAYLPLAALTLNHNVQQAALLFEIVFPAGAGGGVSTLWRVPPYQQHLAGIVRTAPFQALIQLGGSPTVLATPPAGFPGRNLPDLAADADPHTGYLVDRTNPATGASVVETHEGGTSIVAPQFAGTLALIDQLLGHRVGQLNPLLYRLAAAGAAPTRPITTGDNWGYAAHPGYNQAAGLGAMDGMRLYQGLKSFD